jgi:hypothetical protein
VDLKGQTAREDVEGGRALSVEVEPYLKARRVAALSRDGVSVPLDKDDVVVLYT